MLASNIDLGGKRVLVTGAAGFIGANLVLELIRRYKDTGVSVLGIDNMNDYYDVGIKEDRLKKIDELTGGDSKSFTLVRGSISDRSVIDKIFKEFKPEVVVNLAAQAGVRYSIENPDAYIDSNIIGFYNILEACRHSYDEAVADDLYKGVIHLVYASSSSVYGSNKKIPYSVEDQVDNPVSLYAATKKSNELLAHAYSKLYGIPSTGLRFFTVYGPMGRPDMAYYKFTDKIVNGQTIQIYNNGDMRRDFTYIDDAIDGIMALVSIEIPSDQNGVKYKIYNIYK